MKLKSIIGIMAACFLVATPGLASATAITGHITKLYVSTPTNLPFRVFLDTTTSCPGGFFYVDGSSANYQVYVSTLMLAYSQGKSVQLTYDIDASNWCVIRDMAVS